MNCSLILKNLEKTFLQLDLRNNFVRRIENLPQHLSEKFICDNLSIIDIIIRNLDLLVLPRAFLKLSIIVIALAQKGLLMPITGYMWHCFMKVQKLRVKIEEALLVAVEATVKQC